MKKLFLALLIGLQLPALAQQKPNVVLITIDGFRPNFYLEDQWQTPTLHQLLASGAHAMGVNSVFPSMTYPSHTTIMTGVWPAKHGIYYNNKFLPKDSTYWMASSIKVPTIWDLTHAKGMTTASLFWPVSAGAPVKYNIPDNGSLGEANRDQYTTPAGFVEELQQNVFKGEKHWEIGKDQNIAAVAAYIIKKDLPQFMNIHLFSVDHFQHEQGRDGDHVRAAIRDADSAVAIVIDALKTADAWNNTVLIVTGDHGFVDVKTRVSPNVWLEKAGIHTDMKSDGWKARFYSVSGSAYLYLNNKKDKATLKAVEKMLAELSPEEKALFRIIDRKQLDRIGGNPEVALALSGENGASFGNDNQGPATQPGKGGAHGYYPDFQHIRTGFIITGPGIRKGGMVNEMNLRDITPLLAKLLGLDMKNIDGKIPGGILE